MKSPLQDRKYQTSCKDCIFAIYEDKTQVNCACERIKMFKEKVLECYDNDKEFYVIDGLCNLKRSKTWNNGEADVEKAKLESSCTFDVFINCNNITEEYANNIIKFILENSYYNNRFRTTLYHEDTVDKSIRKNITKVYHHTKGTCYISSCKNINTFLHQAMLNSKGAFVFNMDSSNIISSESLTDINNLINTDMKKLLFINDKSHNANCISTTFYKIEQLASNLENYTEIVGNLLSKIQNTELYAEI